MSKTIDEVSILFLLGYPQRFPLLEENYEQLFFKESFRQFSPQISFV